MGFLAKTILLPRRRVRRHFDRFHSTSAAIGLAGALGLFHVCGAAAGPGEAPFREQAEWVQRYDPDQRLAVNRPLDGVDH